MPEKLSTKPEKESAEISEIIVFNDTETNGGASGLLFDSRGGDKISWGDNKYINRPDRRNSNTIIIATASGNQYIVGKGIIYSNDTHRALLIPHGAEVPEVEFGKPWGVPDVFKTSDVMSVLVQYKAGGVEGRFHDDASPFSSANAVLEQKQQLFRERGEY